MKIFKFGGASVKNAAAVRNVAKVLELFPGEKIVIVVSAMGKTTNALEELCHSFFYGKENTQELLDGIRQFHFDIIQELFPDHSHPVYNETNNTFVELDWAIEGGPTHEYDHEYDQIVSVGEVISSKILGFYLREAGVPNQWLDIRGCIQTDNSYREGRVNWELTTELAQKQLVPALATHPVVVTQGFIGSTSENFTTTLGREGSDYTAGILAHCLNAHSVTIWKDVPGVLNADPKWFKNTVLIPQLSYQDAIELAYYGATVIHPKTIKPLQNKNIPLFVRSFVSPAEPGTRIDNEQSGLPTACFIFKVNQVLISIAPKDFSFIVEENLSSIFGMFAERNIKVNLMQNSAISFSVCTEYDDRKTPELIETLQKEYRVLYNKDVELATIRYYDKATIDRVTIDKQVLVEQRSRNTIQLVMRNQNS